MSSSENGSFKVPTKSFVDDLCDFTIRRGNNPVLRVHRAVLCNKGLYFDKLIHHMRGQAELDLSDKDPDAVEHLLTFIYTDDYNRIIKRCRLPIDVLTSDASSGVTTKTAYLATPSQSPSLFSNVIRAHNPSPAVSRYHCHELRQHALVYDLAESCEIERLKLAAQSAFESLICDCWSAPTELLAVVRLVWENSKGPPLGLRASLLEPIVSRIDLLYQMPSFTALMSDCPEFVMDIMNELVPLLPSRKGLTWKYCSYYKCRRNVQTRSRKRNGETTRQCGNCGKIDTLSEPIDKLGSYRKEEVEDEDEEEYEDEDEDEQKDDELLEIVIDGNKHGIVTPPSTARSTQTDLDIRDG